MAAFPAKNAYMEAKPQRLPLVSRRNALALAALALAFAQGGCDRAPPPMPVQPVGDMKETMVWVLDPAADVIWGSAGFVLTAEGQQDLQPTSEEGWARVRHGAAVVAESGNLLLLPHLVPADSEAGTDAWMEFANGMTRVGMELMDAADNQNAEAVFEKGGHLYNVCVACHQVYARNMPQE